MSVATVLDELQAKMGVTLYRLNKLLGLKSTAHIYSLKHGVRTPNVHTSKKIIKLGKEVGMDITLDMLSE
jgi:hypothetical protein